MILCIYLILHQNFNLFIHLSISVWMHGFLFYSIGYNPLLYFEFLAFYFKIMIDSQEVITKIVQGGPVDASVDSPSANILHSYSTISKPGN